MGETKVSVYTQKQAEKFNGKWDKKRSTIQRDGLKLSEDTAELLNDNFAVSGRFYEVDEKATKAYLAKKSGK